MSSSSSSSGSNSYHITGNIPNDPIEFYQDIVNTISHNKQSHGGKVALLRNIEKSDDFLIIDNNSSSTYGKKAIELGSGVSKASYDILYPPSSSWFTSNAAYDILPVNKYCEEIPWNSEPYSGSSMFAVFVDVKVTTGLEEAFIEHTLANCKASLKEPGIHRFDLLRNQADKSHFVLVEVYNNADGPISHKATDHYKTWAGAVANMMAQPRAARKYATLFPKPLHWYDSSYLNIPGEGDGNLIGLSTTAGNSFSFLTPKIVIGRNIAEKAVITAMKEKNINNPLVIVGSSGLERHKSFLDTVLGKKDIPHFRVKGEPTVEDALEAVKIANNNKCDSVLSIGGGSSIDLGKAVAALITNKGDIYDYIEVIGKGMAITVPPVPFIALPTTAGTGSEVTKNAVLKSIKHGRKASMRHDWMVPTVAIVDPMLTMTCPSTITAHVGLDTLCQVIEPYTSNAANPIVDALAKEGILRAARSLRTVVANGQAIQAREDLSIASVMGGLSLANAKLGVVHGFASVLGGMYETAPHGAICAALLPHAFKMNVEKLLKKQESGDKEASVRLARFTDVARICTGNSNATVMDGVKWLAALNRDLAIPSLMVLCEGMKIDDIPTIVKGTAEASSTKGNPIVLSDSELEELLRKAM